MGTNCAPHVANLFLLCNEREFTKSLAMEKRDDMNDALNSTSRYLDMSLFRRLQRFSVYII